MFGGVGGGGFGGAYMMPAGGLSIQTWLDKTAFSEAHRSMAALGTEMKIIGRDFMIAGGLMAIPFMTAAKHAVDAMRDQRAFNAVFGASVNLAEKFAHEWSASTGRFVGDMRKSLMSVTALFKGMGFAEKQSLDMAMATQRLMTDLAAFRGLSDDDVMARFVSTISGGVEAMDQLGINVHEAEVNMELMRMGVNKLAQDATEQEKIVARLNIIYRALASQGALGAAEKATTKLDGALVSLNSEWKETQKIVGATLIPALEKLVPLLNDTLDWVQSFAEQNPLVVRSMAGLSVAVLGLGSALWVAGAASRALTFGLMPVMSMIGPQGIIALAAYGATVWSVASQMEQASQRADRLAHSVENLQRTQRAARQDMTGLSDADRRRVADLQRRIQEIREESRSWIHDLAEGAPGALGGILDGLGDVDDRLNDILWGSVEPQIDEIQKAIQDIFDEAYPQGGKGEKEFQKMGDDIENEIADGIQDGYRRGILGTFSMMSERMFTNLSSSIASTLMDGMKGAGDETLKGSESVQSTERIREAEARQRAIEDQLRNPNLREGERQRLEAAQREAERDLERQRRIQAEQQQRRQQDPGQMSEEEIREMWRNRRQLGQGESWLDPGRKRFQDPGAYIIGDDGEELHYQERGTDPNVPPELQQGGPFGQPYTGPYTGGSSPSGPGPYYIGPDGQMMSGPLAGATEFPVAPGPGDMPAFGGMGGGYERSVEERFAEADAENQAILTQMRDLLQQMVDELRNPDRQDTW